MPTQILCERWMCVDPLHAGPTVLHQYQSRHCEQRTRAAYPSGSLQEAAPQCEQLLSGLFLHLLECVSGVEGSRTGGHSTLGPAKCRASRLPGTSSWGWWPVALCHEPTGGHSVLPGPSAPSLPQTCSWGWLSTGELNGKPEGQGPPDVARRGWPPGREQGEQVRLGGQLKLSCLACLFLEGTAAHLSLQRE